MQTPDPEAITIHLEGKVAIVTGASSGIGSRIAAVLAGAGATVYAVARREERLTQLGKEHRGIVPWAADLTLDAECERLVAGVVDARGGLDILVNNAAISNIARAEDESPDDFRRVLAVNLVAPFALSRLAGAAMQERPDGGSIVNIASIVGLVGLGRMPQAAYASSKGGLIALTRELAAQWARRGVRVNAIAPGWFHTELTDDLFATERGRDWVARLTPMGRAGDLHELDAATLFLASAASSYVTGAVLTVDGGWTAV